MCAHLLFREAKVALAQIEQNGFVGSVEPLVDFVLRQGRAQAQQIGGDGAAETRQHQGPQQLVLHTHVVVCNMSITCSVTWR